jgi:hypothetical protein
VASDSTSSDNVLTDSQGRALSQSVANELQTAVLRIGSPVVARRVWERLFGEEDRQRLGGDLEACWRRLRTVGMWMEARNVTFEQAVIDIAEGVNLMDPGTARWLRRELRLEGGAAVAPPVGHPSWNPETGELRLGSQVIRRVRVLRNPSNIQQILEEFQSTGWPSRIDNPLSLGQQQLHDTLRSLNSGLEAIRFHAQEGGDAVVWEQV